MDMSQEHPIGDPHGVDIAELQPSQETPVSMPPLPVVVDGPAVVREESSEFAGIFTVSGVDTTGAQIVSRDPRRRSFTLWALTDDIRLGRSQAQARSSGAVLPKGQQLTITSVGELWAAAVTTSTDISVVAERWA